MICSDLEDIMLNTICWQNAVKQKYQTELINIIAKVEAK